MEAALKRYCFRSQSRPEKVYVTVVSNDGTITCDCPGWTKRAERICVHTRVVRAGNPEGDPLFVPDMERKMFGISDEPKPRPAIKVKLAPVNYRETLRWATASEITDEIWRSYLDFHETPFSCPECQWFHFPEYYGCNAYRRNRPWPKPPSKPRTKAAPKPGRAFSFDD